jgi:hypothetical protein
MLKEYLKNPDSFILGIVGKENLNQYDIYKYVDFFRFMEIMKTNALSITKISKWEDVYENWFTKCRIHSETGYVDFSRFQNMTFGSCWSFQYNTDAMWRIYSHDRNGIRIKTKIDKYMRAMISKADESSEFKRVYSGVVAYRKKKDIEDIIKKTNARVALERPESYVVNNCLVKRSEFSHEREFRFIALFKTERKEDYISIAIDPNDIIESVMFDPRISDAEFGIRKSVLRDIGYTKTITKSHLYSLPDYKIE